MTSITQQQALWRWDRVPENLRGVLGSEISSDFLWRTCEDNHVPKEKISVIAKLAGYVILGFIHPEDLGREIQAMTGLSAPIASAIGDAINRRIFVPIRGSLDSIYNPKPDDGPVEEKEEVEMEAGPKIFEETRPPIRMGEAGPPRQNLGEVSAPKPLSSPPQPYAKTTAAPPTPVLAPSPLKPVQPTKISPAPVAPTVPGAPSGGSSFQPGWSQTKAQPAPLVPIKPVATPMPKPTTQTPPPAPAASPVFKPTPSPKEVSLSFSSSPASLLRKSDEQVSPEKELPSPVNLISKPNLSIPSPLPIKPAPAPRPPVTPPPFDTAQGKEPLPTPSPLRKDEGPAIIHEEPKSVAPRPSGFSFRPGANLSDMPMPTKNLPPKPAVLEFSKKDTESAYTPPKPPTPSTPLSAPKTPAPTPSPFRKGEGQAAPRVVHYSEMKTNLPAPAPKPPMPQK